LTRFARYATRTFWPAELAHSMSITTTPSGSVHANVDRAPKADLHIPVGDIKLQQHQVDCAAREQ
jgi:hypothetical protein